MFQIKQKERGMQTKSKLSTGLQLSAVMMGTERNYHSRFFEKVNKPRGY